MNNRFYEGAVQKTQKASVLFCPDSVFPPTALANGQSLHRINSRAMNHPKISIGTLKPAANQLAINHLPAGNHLGRTGGRYWRRRYFRCRRQGDGQRDWKSSLLSWHGKRGILVGIGVKRMKGQQMGLTHGGTFLSDLLFDRAFSLDLTL